MQERGGQRLAHADDVLVEPEDGPAQQEAAVSRERAPSLEMVVGGDGGPGHRGLEQAF